MTNNNSNNWWEFLNQKWFKIIKILELNKEIIEELKKVKSNVTSIISQTYRLHYWKLKKLVEDIDREREIEHKLKLINNFFNIFNLYLFLNEKETLIFPKFFDKYLEYKEFVLINKIQESIKIIDKNKYWIWICSSLINSIKEFEKMFWWEKLAEKFWQENLQNYINFAQNVLKKSR